LLDLYNGSEDIEQEYKSNNAFSQRSFESSLKQQSIFKGGMERVNKNTFAGYHILLIENLLQSMESEGIGEIVENLLLIKNQVKILHSFIFSFFFNFKF
jgi:hypothetical protein